MRATRIYTRELSNNSRANISYQPIEIGGIMIIKTAMRLALVIAMSWITAVAQTDTITIIHVNDSHSNLSPLGPRDASFHGTVGGIARVATVLKNARETEPNVMFLHAGDFSIGDVYFNAYLGMPELSILQQLGLDAMTVGNHEFDLTPDVFAFELSSVFDTSAAFPVLSANLVYPPDTLQALHKYVKPYTIKTLGGLKVGIIGLTTPETNLLSLPAPVFVDTNFIQTAAAYVDTLKNKGCGVVILLSHLGLAFDEAVASYVPGIDVIVGGHDHYVLTQPVPVVNPSSDTTWIVQAGAFYEYAGKLRLRITSGRAHLLDYQLIHLDNTIPEDQTISAIVDGLDAGMQSVVGQDIYNMIFNKTSYVKSDFTEVADSLSNPGLHDTPVGDLVTDAFRALTGTDIAITAGGSTAQPLHHGPVTGQDIYRMISYGYNTDNGFGYRLATFKLSGEDLIKGLEYTLGTIEANDEFFMQVSGMRYSYVAGQNPGQRVYSVNVGGAAINPTKMYTVTSNEFVLGMISGVIAPQMGMTVVDPHVMPDTTEFQAVYAYAAAADTLVPAARRRVIEGPVDGVPVSGKYLPKTFSLNQNYPNPFNPSTTISFSLPEKSFVTLKVYNVLGVEMATLAESVFAPGDHSVIWNADRFPSGVYFCRIEAGRFQAVKKMMFVK